MTKFAENLKRHGLRTLVSKRTWWFFMAAYVAMIVTILSPVLLAPIYGDDSYWVTSQRPIMSYWQAWWEPVAHAFDFTGQPRATALAFSERRVLALFTIDTAKLFAIPPSLVWTVVKTLLIGVNILAVPVFLKQIRFRDRLGAVRRISRSTIVFITLAMPLVIALGAKSQNVGTVNGWNFYPTLTYGPFAGFLLMAALVLALSRRLESDYRTWAVPTIVLMMFFGFTINLSYELVALMIPVATFVLLVQPFADAPSAWLKWRARLTVMVPLGATYSAIFLWIRWRISGMPCHDTGTCYPGTEIDIKPRSLAYNFFGAFPGNNADFVGDQAHAAGRDFPGVSAFSITIAVIGTLALLGLCASWAARARQTRDAAANPSERDDDTRGLLIVLAVAVLIALGSSAITGITAATVQKITTPMLSNRNGVMTWMALALAGLTVVRLLMTARWKAVRPLGLIGLATVLVVGISLYLPRNILTAQENRLQHFRVLVDSIHHEVALGDTSATGDARRCAAIAAAYKPGKIPSGEVTVVTGNIRSLNGAYAAFDYYYGLPYCSQELGHTTVRGAGS